GIREVGLTAGGEEAAAVIEHEGEEHLLARGIVLDAEAIHPALLVRQLTRHRRELRPGSWQRGDPRLREEVLPVIEAPDVDRPGDGDLMALILEHAQRLR